VMARQYTRRPPMRLVPEIVLTPDGWRRDTAITVTDGRIAQVGAAGGARGGDVALPGRALLPGTVNAHGHTFQPLLRGLGDDLDFAGWRDRVLYPFSERHDREGIALGAAFAFAEMLRHGVTTCVDFFYLNDSGHDDEEIALMGARGAALAYCPSSNMFLGDGVTRVPELLRAGVRVGLGTDGGCTNSRLSVFEEMRMASLLQRVRLLDGGALPAASVFGLGTESGAAILGLPAGQIEAGRLADFVAVDLGHASLHPATNL